MSKIAVDLIAIPESRLRPFNPEKVKEIAKSIEINGLINPVVIDGNNTLIAGLHRLEAVKSLGWETIPYVNKGNLTQGQAELIEIDENLIRQELTVLEQAEHIARREQLLEEMGLRAKAGFNQYTDNSLPILAELEAGNGGDTVTLPKTTQELAQEIGMTDRSFQRRKQIAKDILPEVKESLRETPVADSTTQLLEVARMQPEEQKEFVDALQSGEVESVKQFKVAIAVADPEPVLKEVVRNTEVHLHVEDFTPVKIDGQLTLVPKSALEGTDGQSSASMPNRFTSMEKSAKTDVHPTPERITRYLYEFFGEIDLDPCSDLGKNIKAKKHYTIEDNGLTQDWEGKLFINPPFSEVAQWAEKAIADYQAGKITELIFLSKFDARVGWFKPLINTAIMFCAVEGYVSFEGNNGNPATFSTVLWYFGDRDAHFLSVFSELGWVCQAFVRE